MMRAPKITKRERRLYLSYELPQHVYCSSVYPITAANGSTLILYGHESGLRILWRGGRPRRQLPPQTSQADPPGRAKTRRPRVNGTDESRARQTSFHEATDLDFEDEEEELDADCPYPAILEDVDINLGTGVIRLAVPVLPPASNHLPSYLRNVAVLALATSDGVLRILQIPLAPPIGDAIEDYIRDIATTQVILSDRISLPAALEVKVTTVAMRRNSQVTEQTRTLNYQLLIACANRSLNIWTLPIATTAVLANPDSLSLQIIPLLQSAHRLSFHPALGNAQLLLVESLGNVRIFDPLSPSSKAKVCGSEDTDDPTAESAIFAATQELGRWITTFHAPFSSADKSTLLVRRKKILDAAWTLGGRAIFALLDDGEWGVWDISGESLGTSTSVTAGSTLGQKNNKNPDEFVIHGFLDSSNSVGPSASSTASSVIPSLTKQRKAVSKLAPMTPNTRKAKAENLFSGAPKIPGRAPKGGISVTWAHSASGQADESAILWYNNEIFSITDMQAFWQRSVGKSSAQGNNSNSFGSLYSPGMLHLTDIDPLNEDVTSVSHFPLVPYTRLSATTTNGLSNGLGRIKAQKDLLVSTEHRLIISQAAHQPQTVSTASSSSRALLFQQAATSTDATMLNHTQLNRDQQMLGTGDLDVGGMDRLLDGMAAANGDPGLGNRPRKVGFATFTE